MPTYTVTIRGYGWFHVTAPDDEVAAIVAEESIARFGVPVGTAWGEFEVEDIEPCEDGERNPEERVERERATRPERPWWRL